MRPSSSVSCTITVVEGHLPKTRSQKRICFCTTAGRGNCRASATASPRVRTTARADVGSAPPIITAASTNASLIANERGLVVDMERNALMGELKQEVDGGML